MTPEQMSLPRSTPAQQGVHAQRVIDFVDGVKAADLELHSLMIVRHGHVIAEGFWQPYAAQLPHMLFSLSKSFTSTAVGLAIAEGRLALDDLVLSFFSDEVPKDISTNLAAMRVRDLLTMSTGHQEEPRLRQGATDENWVRAFFAATVEYAPGTHFVYNSGATYILSAIVQKVTGQDLLAYLEPRLFAPLGIVGATWERSPQGVCAGGWGLNIRTEDIAKFGQLYLQQGEWEGQRLIPSSWIAQATDKQIANDVGKSEDECENSDWAQGYGYQFWRCRHGAYRGDGAFGQFCIVMPAQDMVIAITSGVRDMQAVLAQVWTHLLPACEAAVLDADAMVTQTLAQKLAGLTLNPPRYGVPGHERTISGRTYRMQEASSRIHTISFSFHETGLRMTVANERGEHVVECGRESWVKGTTSLLGSVQAKVAASASWQDEHTCEVTCRFYETPFTMRLVCTFDEDEVVVRESINVSFGPTEYPPLRGSSRITAER